MKRVPFSAICFLSLSIGAWAVEESMPGMPRIVPKRTYKVETVEQGESLLEERGYGDQEPIVRMMNLMMVGGSGYEGMDMSQMSSGAPATPDHVHGHTKAGPAIPNVPAPAEGQTGTYEVQTRISPDSPRVGTNVLDIVVQTKNTAMPARGLKIKAQVSMTSMDMGIEMPKVKEISPGKYRAKVTFSMAGPWAVKLSLPEGGEKVLTFNVK